MPNDPGRKTFRAPERGFSFPAVFPVEILMADCYNKDRGRISGSGLLSGKNQTARYPTVTQNGKEGSL